MKTTHSLAAVLAIVLVTLALGGCGSPSTESTVSPEQRAQQQAADLKNIPAPAQALAAQRSQEKSQMDAMRAKDAAKSAQPQ
ncbi:hypothetical protein B1R32_106163 [Abditibacterium utsteinense]|uniref:Secreted protein n=1 Tax=Abditibacterium utsteinense TaxID=1960156 RepID=A0A2S8SU29_9BACT|nr:hypothetical protein [Abditibacterium utsteinense]PQV64317.1 hypothetical protein B1R32_106163 [Abditibacterium utsteinense]